MMELPQFKYSPNAYQLDIFEKVEGTCSICNEKRNIKYKRSFYAIEKPDYICPWCIANGAAAKKYNGEFNDYLGIEGVSPDPSDPPPSLPKDLILEICNKTPSYFAMQSEQWLCHCNEPCAFLGYVDSNDIKPILEELKEDIEVNIGFPSEVIINHLSKDSSFYKGYLFQCLKCKKHRLHADCD